MLHGMQEKINHMVGRFRCQDPDTFYFYILSPLHDLCRQGIHMLPQTVLLRKQFPMTFYNEIPSFIDRLMFAAEIRLRSPESKFSHCPVEFHKVITRDIDIFIGRNPPI